MENKGEFIMNIQKSDTLSEYIKGMNKFRSQLVQPAKDSDNPFFKSKYVDLAGVQVAIDNALVGTGLTYQQWEESREDGSTGVGTIVMHEKGEYIVFPPYYMKPEKHTPQGQGSTITYLRRYTLSTVFGVTSDVDDDGNEASGKGSSKSNSSQSPKSNQGKEITEPTQSVDDSIKAGYAKIKSLSGEFDTNEKINAWIKDKGKYEDLRKVNKAEILAWLGKLFQQINQKG